MNQGINEAITAAEYHADPCPTPSLSSSVAKLLIQRSPRHAWLAHPKLGSATTAKEDPSHEFALGTLVHRLTLGKGGEIVEIEADSWRTKDAREARDYALKQGNIPVLPHELEEGKAIANAGRQQLDDMGFKGAYLDGRNEVVITWQEDGLWLRAMLDSLTIDEKLKTAQIRDLKTVGRSSHPAACAKQISDLGYDLSLAFYKRGLIALRPELGGRIKYLWDFLEVEPPYALTPVEISGEWEMAADAMVDRAISKWKECMASGCWPFYTDRIVRLDPKPWVIAAALGEEN